MFTGMSEKKHISDICRTYVKSEMLLSVRKHVYIMFSLCKHMFTGQTTHV